MFQFLETIQLLDGKFNRLHLHQARMERARSEHFPLAKQIPLAETLAVSDFPKIGLYKCRVIYDSEIRLLEFVPYTSPIIRSLKAIETNMPSLEFKTADRSAYQDGYSKRDGCDDVLFIKNGLVTDTSYCNVALWDGSTWLTPSHPLVYGVNRADLIMKKEIIESEIYFKDLMNFQQITLFNAMNKMSSICISIDKIYT